MPDSTCSSAGADGGAGCGSDDGLLGIPFDLADGSRALLLAEGCREDADPIVLGVFTGYCVLALGNCTRRR